MPQGLQPQPRKKEVDEKFAEVKDLSDGVQGAEAGDEDVSKQAQLRLGSALGPFCCHKFISISSSIVLISP